MEEGRQCGLIGPFDVAVSGDHSVFELPFALLGHSGSGWEIASSRIPRRPRKDSIVAKNQASYSLVAMTTSQGMFAASDCAHA